jgi:hypothetical protein
MVTKIADGSEWGGKSCAVTFHALVRGEYKPQGGVLCVAKEETSVDVVCRELCCNFTRISVRLSFIVSERLIDATSILHYELEAPPV